CWPWHRRSSRSVGRYSSVVDSCIGLTRRCQAVPLRSGDSWPTPPRTIALSLLRKADSLPDADHENDETCRPDRRWSGGEETRVRGFDLRVLLGRCVECAVDGVEGFEELFLCAFPLVDHCLEVLSRASAPAFLEGQQIAQHRLRLGHEIERSACGGGGSGLYAFGVDFETHDGSSRSGVRFSRPARASRDQCRPHGPGRKEHGKRVWTALGCPHPPRGRVVTASPGSCGRVRSCRRPPLLRPWTVRAPYRWP